MPPKTQRGERTRAAFLDAARQEFAEKGYFNAKISDIAERAGRSSGSFYNYYENKELLLADLVNEFPRDVLRRAFSDDRGSDIPSRIEAAVNAYYSAYRTYLPEMVGVFQLSMTQPEFRDRWLALRAAGVRALVGDIDHFRKRSGIPRKVRSEVLASALVSMLEGFCWVWMAAGGEKGIEAPNDAEAIATLTHVWTHAVLASPPAAEASSGPRASHVRRSKES
jgi:AcrR family transcriptional regulator